MALYFFLSQYWRWPGYGVATLCMCDVIVSSHRCHHCRISQESDARMRIEVRKLLVGYLGSSIDTVYICKLVYPR
jgi:hypothetical protein